MDVCSGRSPTGKGNFCSFSDISRSVTLLLGTCSEISSHPPLVVLFCVCEIAKLLWFAGKSTGIVTTARLTHATPAAAYGHSPSRYFEHNVVLSKSTIIEPEKCTDLATQLIRENSYINVCHALSATVQFLRDSHK